MTPDDLRSIRIAAGWSKPIDPMWLRICLQKLDETRIHLDQMCALYERSQRQLAEQTAELQRHRAVSRDGF